MLTAAIASCRNVVDLVGCLLHLGLPPVACCYSNLLPASYTALVEAASGLQQETPLFSYFLLQLNTFQMVLASSRHGKTYLILMYSRLQWTTGSASGGSGGLGGTVAQAGYSSARLGVGSVSLPGSGTPAILHLSDWSNSQITGTFVFCVNDFICMDTQMYPQPTGKQKQTNIICSCRLCLFMH